MAGMTLENFISNYSPEEIKKMIFSLIEQFLPAFGETERQDFIVKLIGKSGDDKLSSMVSR